MLKSWMESLLIAFSMYSTVPVKCLNWTPKNLRNAMVFFPWVGLLCGSAVCIIWMGCTLLHIGSVLFGVLAVTASVAVTGGIHLDGFCDTADALYSRRPQAEKLRILKDPNCGPFAVFSVILVLMVSAGSYSQLYTVHRKKTLLLLLCGFVISRCLSGISVTAFPCAPSSTLAKTFGEHAGKHVTAVLLAECAAVSAIVLIFFQWIGLILLTAAAVCFILYYYMQKKQFGGVTGDLAGFFLVLCETVWLLGAALTA